MITNGSPGALRTKFVRIRDLDVFYISYDEPDCDATFARLCAMAPRPVGRVHGVKGFHQAHRRCAELSATARFVTIDGDNEVEPALFDQEIDADLGRDLVFSFKAQNLVNGLAYGNGGVKVWPRGLVLHVPTHEAEGAAHATDFCWTYRYFQVNVLGSRVVCHRTPEQAFRAGYREAVKLTFVDGGKLPTWRETMARIYPPNLSRLRVWASVGRDVENGAWAIHGARRALYDVWLAGRDPEVISDYDRFAAEVMPARWVDDARERQDLARLLSDRLGLDCVDLSPDQSRWFKATYINPPRAGLMLPQLPAVDFPDV